MTVLAGTTEPIGRSVEVAMFTRADPSRVWQALTDAERVVEWFADRVQGTITPGATLTWSFDRPSSDMSFLVSPLTATGRLVLRAEGPIRSSLEITVTPVADGAGVHLVHGGFPAESSWDEHFMALTSSWQVSLAILRYYVEFHFGQSRRRFFAGRQGRFSLARLRTLFREPAGLQEWLTDGGSLGTPGGRVHLALKSGEVLRGDMLADTSTDIAMAWDEIGGVLQLRALPVADGTGARSICAMGWGWGVTVERARQIERDLDAALERLEHAADTLAIGQGTLQSR